MKLLGKAFVIQEKDGRYLGQECHSDGILEWDLYTSVLSAYFFDLSADAHNFLQERIRSEKLTNEATIISIEFYEPGA